MTPAVSVVLPTYRTGRTASRYWGTFGSWNGMAALGTEGEAGLRRLDLVLASLEHQTLPPSRYEVVVVDDGGPVDPAAVVEHHRGEMAVRLVRQPHQGMVHAINRGVAAAAGEIVFLALDHTLLRATTLEAHLATHQAAGPATTVVGCGRQHLLPHSALFRDIGEANVEAADVVAFGRRVDGEWIYRALEMMDLHTRTIDRECVRDGFRRIELLSSCTPEYRDIERALGTSGDGLRCPWLAMRFGNHSLRRELLDRAGGLDPVLDDHAGWYADLDLGLRLHQEGAAFRLVEEALAVGLFHGASPEAALGKATGLAYLLGKHGCVEIALLPHYMDRIGLTIEEFGAQAEAAAGWWVYPPVANPVPAPC